MKVRLFHVVRALRSDEPWDGCEISIKFIRASPYAKFN
jgi:hypothetical protein